MSERTEPKVIAIGDYVKELDKIVSIPVMHDSEEYLVEVRVMKPMADYEQKTLELLSITFGDRLEALSKRGEIDNILELPPEERKELILFTWLTTASLVSACCYHPDKDENGNKVPKEEARLIWEDETAVGAGCPSDVFAWLKKYLQGIDKTVSEVEAKK